MDPAEIKLPKDLVDALTEGSYRQSIRDSFQEVKGFTEEQMDRAVVVIKDADARIKSRQYTAEAVGGLITSTVDWEGRLLSLNVDNSLLYSKDEKEAIANKGIISQGAKLSFDKACEDCLSDRKELVQSVKSMLWQIHKENCDDCPENDSCVVKDL